MPTTMSLRASVYQFSPGEIIAQNGDGEDIMSAEGASVVWQWAQLSADEWDYLYTSVLGGNPSAKSTSENNTTVYNNARAEQSYSNAVVHRPSYETLSGNTYFNVGILINQLR